MISVQTELGRSANSSDISNDGLFSIASAMVDPKHWLEYFGWNSPLPKCLLNLRHREERMLQFGFHHNILYGHIMRLLGPLHTSFENLGNHQAIYGLMVAVIDPNRAHLAIHAARNAFDLNRNVCVSTQRCRACLRLCLPKTPFQLFSAQCNIVTFRIPISWLACFNFHLLENH